MSQNNNVFENWEEIDDDNISTQLCQLKKDIKPQVDIMSSQEMPFHHNNLQFMMVMRQNEEYGANYSNSTNKPTVKILKRPTTQQKNEKSEENRQKQPMKTLQQREQEYAEARLRILGSAKNPEDELESNISTMIAKRSSELTGTTSSLHLIGSNSGEFGNNVDINISNHLTDNNETTTTTSLQYFNSNLMNNDQLIKTQCILRMPKGPDGTPGFNLRR